MTTSKRPRGAILGRVLASIIAFFVGSLVGVFFAGELGASPGYVMLAGLVVGLIAALLPWKSWFGFQI